MPLIIPKTLPAYDALYEENVFVMHRERALAQHIRPLEILILNLMPTKIATETQIARLLANTPLGMIQLPIIKATTTHIPVILGAILLGPMAGAILGGVFGLCSLVSNTIAPVAASVCFSPFIAISLGGPLSAVKALWVSVGCRILIGVVAGWLWLALKKVKVNDLIALPIVGAAVAMTNTASVMGSIFFLFRAEYAAANNLAVSAMYDFVMATVTGAGVMEAIAAAVLVTAIGKALLKLKRPVLSAA